MSCCIEGKRVLHEKEYGEGFISEHLIGKASNGEDWVYVVFDNLPKEENTKTFLFPTAFKKDKGGLRFIDENDQKLVDDIIQQNTEQKRLKQEQEQKEREARERAYEEQLAQAAEEEKKSRLKKYNTDNRYNEKRFYPVEDMILSSFKTLRDKYLAGEYKPNRDFPARYDNPLDQNIYILRYIYAYTYEYQKMFERLLRMWGKKDEMRMLSIGCGAMLDAWAMQEALLESRSNCSRVVYQGLDINDWNSSINTQENIVKKMPLKVERAGSYFRDISKLEYDVYCFPKSIGDIAGKDRQSPEYYDILNAFRTKPLCNNELYIAASLINYSNEQLPDDAILVDRIKAVLEERGYRCSDSFNRIGRDTDGSIIETGYEMAYPIYKDLIEMLAGQNPTFLRRYERYYIYKFVRGDNSDFKR